jgi:tetratricopeptide (TPR) repeat protein
LEHRGHMSKRRQPQRLPPPLMHGAEAIDSEIILREFTDDLGLLLWKTVRSIRVWSELPEGERGKAFEPGAHESRSPMLASTEVPEAIAGPLTKAASVLMPRARAATVATACRSIATWCFEEGRIGTAVEFMQTAAVLLPDDAELAHEVAKMARMRTDYGRAETWYRQAISRARKAGVWSEFSRSYIGMGIVFRLRGSYPQARSSMVRGLRAAKRFSIRPLAAAAYHELTVLAIDAQKGSEAVRYAKLAIDAYGPGHERLPALAHDFALYLMGERHFNEALRTFVALRSIGGPRERLSRAASIVWAAGAAGEASTFESAWAEAQNDLGNPAASTTVVPSLIAMARGAAYLGNEKLATETAQLAQQLAAERGEFAGEAAVDILLAEFAEARENANVEAPAPPAVWEVVERFEGSLLAAGH